MKTVYVTTLFKRDYPRSHRELVRDLAKCEDERRIWYKAPPLPKYEKKELNLTPAAVYGLAGECFKFIWSLRP
jgi:hypothetical protein